MKWIKYTLLFFIVFYFCCWWRWHFGFEDYVPSEKVKIARVIRSKVAKKLHQEMNLIPFGFGGQMMYQIQKLCLDFEYRHPIDIEEARQILVRVTNIFLDEVNANEQVRPYLHNYPFLPKNLEVMIVIQNPNGSHIDGSKLSIIIIRDGFLEYKLSNKKTHEYITQYKESYEEALNILKQQEKERTESLCETDGT